MTCYTCLFVEECLGPTATMLSRWYIGSRKLIGSIIPLVASMPLQPLKLYLVLLKQGIEERPQIVVLLSFPFPRSAIDH